MNDSKIIDLFFERSEKAIIELSRKYEPLCMAIALNVLGNRQDAEECVNDSYLAVWNTVPPQKPNPLRSYLCRMIRNIAINRYKYNNAKKRNGIYDICLEELENAIGSSNCIDERINGVTLVSYIEEFLDNLDEVNRMIFIRRFWYMDSYSDISKASKLKEGAIRVRITRVKSELRSFLATKGVII